MFKIVKLSVAGVRYAAIAALTAEGIKALRTADENKPATKGDFLKKVVNVPSKVKPEKGQPISV